MTARDPLAEPCPYRLCGRGPYQPCADPNTGEDRKPHVARIRAAEKKEEKK